MRGEGSEHQAEPELPPLNQPQADAVAHVDGPLIVFAGAGSGKTRVITYRIANLVARHRLPPYAVLAVTFTNKAAGEMRHRLDDMLGPQLTRDLWIGTFHAVCVRLLRRHHEEAGLSANFVIYDDSDQKAVMKRILSDLAIDERRHAPASLLGRIHREKQEARGPEDFEADNYFDDVVLRCFTEYEKRMRQANACDFEDLLLHVLRIIEDPNSEAGSKLRRRYRYVLVDEFQDVNLVQYRLVRAFAGDHQNICVVGDDDQSIYRWRGADVRNIRGFTRDYPDAKLIKLEQNYRSTQNIVGAALGVIRLAADRQPKELWTANEPGEPVSVVHCSTERDEAAFVVDGVKKQIAAEVSPRQLAVFYRTHAQSRILEEVMRTEGVPYQIIGGTKFFDRAEVKNLLAYLRVISNPQSDVDLARIINVPPRKIGAKTIEKLTSIANEQRCCLYDGIVPLCASDRVGTAAKRSLRALDELFQCWMRAATTASPRELAEQVLLDSGYVRALELQDSAEADARLENLHELLGSISEYEEDCASAGEIPTLHEYLSRISLAADVDNMKDAPRVPMMTVHAAKGLEFHSVWLTGMEERLFPLRGQEPGEEDELHEERRLAYVAITRARIQLFITHTNTRLIYGQTRYNDASRFLAELPPQHHQRIASESLHAMSRDYTLRSSAKPWQRRDNLQAYRQGAPSSRRRRPAVQPPAAASPSGYDAFEPGERFVERDEHVDNDDFAQPSLHVGGRVRHAKYGIGTIMAVRQGADPTVSVKFPGWPTKQIKLSFLTRA